jgi:hypothetical protein
VQASGGLMFGYVCNGWHGDASLATTAPDTVSRCTKGQLHHGLRTTMFCRYDNGVSGGVSSMDHFLAKFYPGEQALQILWPGSDKVSMHGQSNSPESRPSIFGGLAG